MTAIKIDQLENTMEGVRCCGACWHFVRYMDSPDTGWCGSSTSVYEDQDVHKSTPACSCWNLKPLFDFWG